MSANQKDSRRGIAAIILGIDALLILFPPLHWIFGNGSPVSALGYVIGSSILILASLYVLDRLEERSRMKIRTGGAER